MTKHIISVILTIIVIGILLSGCVGNNEDVSLSPRFETVSFKQGFWGCEYVIADKETGVLYIWIRSGYGGGLTPLLDSDGNVQFYDGEK